MTVFTKEAIKKTTLGLLKKKPLSEITVNEIAEECGINRNTFYYHFRDMQAVVEEILLDQVNSVLADHPTLGTFEECLYAIIDVVKLNREVIMNVYNSMNRVAFEKYLWEVSYVLVENYWNTTLVAQPALKEKNRRLILDYYGATCFGLAMKWLSTGLDDRGAKRDVHELCKLALTEPMTVMV